MKKIILMLGAVFLLFPLKSFCQDIINPASEDVSSIYAACAAYYNLYSNAEDSSYARASADSYRQLENTAKLYSLLLSAAGASKGQGVDATNAKFARYVEDMKSETGKNEEKLSNYHFGCQEALDNPPDRLVQILGAMLNK